MARNDDIRFDKRAVEISHASSRGEVTRNMGVFSRGAQLVRLRYTMLYEGLGWPLLAGAGIIAATFVFYLWITWQPHQADLIETSIYANLWSLFGGNPDKIYEITLPDETVVSVAMSDVANYPEVRAAWQYLFRVSIGSIVVGSVLAFPAVKWFIQTSRQTGRDILKERQERGATLIDAETLKQEIETHNHEKLCAEVRKTYADEKQPEAFNAWFKYVTGLEVVLAELRAIYKSRVRADTAQSKPLGHVELVPEMHGGQIVAEHFLGSQDDDQEISPSRRDRAADMRAARRVLAKLPPRSDEWFCPYTLAGIPYPWRLEQSHTMLIGTTGAGKTTEMKNIVTEARMRGHRCVVFDLTGAYVEAFYDADTDFILNPIDVRCPAWTIFSDCDNYPDFMAASLALIPHDGGNQEPFWTDAARTLFVEMCIKLQDEGETSNGALAHHLMNADLKSIHKRLEDTIASPLTTTEAARMAESIRAVFNTNAQALRFLSDPVPDGPPAFSIRKWMREGNPGSILYMTSKRSDLALTKKLITLWVDIAVNAIMDMPRTDKLRTWFLFDEIHALHRLPAIENGMQAARNFGGAFMLGIHSFAKLCETYGEHGATHLASLARTKLMLTVADTDTADKCSEWIGSREVREVDEAYSIGATRSRDAATITPRTEVKPLVMLDDLTNLPALTGYIKFPEGFPAARISDDYIDYPNVAEGFQRKLKITTVPYVPKIKPDEGGGGDAGREIVPERAPQATPDQSLAERADPEQGQERATASNNGLVLQTREAAVAEPPIPNERSGVPEEHVIGVRPIPGRPQAAPQAPTPDEKSPIAAPDTSKINTFIRARSQNAQARDVPITQSKEDTARDPSQPSAGKSSPQRPLQQAITDLRTGQGVADPSEVKAHHREPAPVAGRDRDAHGPDISDDSGMEI